MRILGGRSGAALCFKATDGRTCGWQEQTSAAFVKSAQRGCSLDRKLKWLPDTGQVQVIQNIPNRHVEARNMVTLFLDLATQYWMFLVPVFLIGILTGWMASGTRTG
ncbi:MAG: hypothetical protein GXP01_08885 [Alphaproteobacteria bacterium]|nr:hypothetical protein [Alphaproteobacteria bacterium]